MRAYLPDYSVINPRDLEGALEALASGYRVVPLAGGTDLMCSMEWGSLPPCTFLNLQAISDFQHPVRLDEGLTLGPLATFRHARVNPEIRDNYSLLTLAAREVGVLGIQSRATWIGNVANASPAADGVPALMAHDAVLVLASSRGQRKVPLSKFYLGYKEMDLRPDELILSIHLPRPEAGWTGYFHKVGARRYQAISKVVFAGRLLRHPDGRVKDARIVVGSVYPYTLRAFGTEAVLLDRPLSLEVIAEADKRLQTEIRPIDDHRSTALYRRRVTSNLLRQFLLSAGSS